MQRLILLATSISWLFFSCTPRSPQYKSDDLLGDWYTIKGDVEYYNFSRADRIYKYSGILNDKAVFTGTFRIEGNKLWLLADNGTNSVYALRISNDSLILNQGVELYTRLKPDVEVLPEVETLKNISKNINLKFSGPEPDELNCNTRSDTSNIVQGLTINGYSICADVEIPNGDYSVLSKYTDDITVFLKKQSFITDNLNTTEMRVAYRNDNQIVFLLTTSTPDENGSSAQIKLQCGIIGGN
jgi:hypothetical protein